MTDSLDGVPELSSMQYHQLALGDAFGPFEEPLAQATSDGLRGALGTRRSGELAPPGVLPMLTLRILRRALRGIIPGGILTRQRLVAHADIPADATLSADVRVSAQDRGTAGLFTTFTFTLRHEQTLCAVVDWTILAVDQEPAT